MLLIQGFGPGFKQHPTPLVGEPFPVVRVLGIEPAVLHDLYSQALERGRVVEAIPSPCQEDVAVDEVYAVISLELAPRLSQDFQAVV
jgi:hypothetical protein